MSNPLEVVNPCAEVLADNPYPLRSYQAEALSRFQQTIQADMERTQRLERDRMREQEQGLREYPPLGVRDEMLDRERDYRDRMRDQDQARARERQQAYAQTFGRGLREAPSSRTLEERAKTAAGRYIRSKFNGPTETITALEAIDLLTDFHVIMQRAQTPSRISARSMASDDRNAYHAFDELRRRDVEISALRARVRLMKQQIENQAVPEPKPAEIAIKAIEGEGRQFRHELYEEPA